LKKDPKAKHNSKRINLDSFLSLISTAKWILGKRHSTILVLASISQIIVALLDVLFLALIGPLVIYFSDNSATDDKFSILGRFTIASEKIFILIVLIVLVKNIAGLVIQRLLLSSFAIREAEVSTALVQAALFNQNDNRQTLHSSSLLQTFTATITLVFGNLFKPLIVFIGELATLSAVIIGLLIINTKIAIAAICYFVIFGYLIIWYLGKKQQTIGKNSFEQGRELLRSFTEIRLMNRELRFAHKDLDALLVLNQSKINHAKLISESVFLTAIPRYLFEIIFLFGIGFMILLSQYSPKSQPVLSTLSLLVAAGYRILPSLNYITIAIGNFRNSISPLQSLDSLGRQFNTRLTDLKFSKFSNNRERQRFGGDLHLENVSYRYPISKKSIYTDFNLVIKSGTTLLIQGPSGSGKTTFIELVSGSLTPQQGRIYTLAGKQEIAMNRSIIGISYLSQDVPLLDESFAYNIALREPLEKDFTRLTYAANEAGILDLILQSPLGFNSQIGENGAQLSAGERQRLGIARSLYSEPALLILDEPTANLDAFSENLIWDSLIKLKGKLTILIVSHRTVPEYVFDTLLKLPNSKSK